MDDVTDISHKYYREAFKESRDGLVVVDLEGKILDANQAYCDMLGYCLDELRSLGHTLFATEIGSVQAVVIGQRDTRFYGAADKRRIGGVVSVRLKKWH